MSPQRTKRARLESMSIAEDTLVGTMMAFGSGGFDQLGIYTINSDGEETHPLERKFPFPVTGLENVSVHDFACMGFHNIVALSDGSVVTWGCNDDKVLGRPVEKEGDSDDAGRVRTIPDLHGIVQVCGGEYHMVALDREGSVFAWGSYKEADGFLGFLPNEPSDYKQVAPAKIKFDEPVVEIASGANATFCLTKSGKVFEWGALRRSPKQVRPNHVFWLTPHEVLLPRGVKAKKIWAGGYSSFLQSESGEVFGWGLDNKGQLGLGGEAQANSTNEEERQEPRTNPERPQLVTALSPAILGETVAEIAVGEQHAIALTASGKVLAWGASTLGQLGLGDAAVTGFDYIPSPAEIPFFQAMRETTGATVVEVTAGSWHFFARSSDGNVFAWGQNEGLRLGTGEEEEPGYEATPVLLKSSKLDSHRVLKMSAAVNHNLFLMAEKK